MCLVFGWRLSFLQVKSVLSSEEGCWSLYISCPPSMDSFHFEARHHVGHMDIGVKQFFPSWPWGGTFKLSNSPDYKWWNINCSVKCHSYKYSWLPLRAEEPENISLILCYSRQDWQIDDKTLLAPFTLASWKTSDLSDGLSGPDTGW